VIPVWNIPIFLRINKMIPETPEEDEVTEEALEVEDIENEEEDEDYIEEDVEKSDK
jgi:hypothetical protein